MKLFYKPGACSLATHIILQEVGASFELEQVDTQAQTTASGLDFSTINPKGYVPALALGSGEILSEGVAILQYIADQYPHLSLAPEAASIERIRLQVHLNYVGSELHKAFGPLFSNKATELDKQQAIENVSQKLAYVETLLSNGKRYLLGDEFTIADAYLFVVSNWANVVGIDLSPWPQLDAFIHRVAQRPATQAAMKAEGLIDA